MLDFTPFVTVHARAECARRDESVGRMSRSEVNRDCSVGALRLLACAGCLTGARH